MSTPESPQGALPLFRSEALAEQQSQWLGTVVITPRLSYRLFSLFALLSSIAVIGLLFFTDYTRKERINGWLVPEHGLVQVYAPQPGVITNLYVKEGIEVNKGDALLTLSGELQSTTLGATRTEIVKSLKTQRDSLLKARLELEKLLVQQTQVISDRTKLLTQDLNELNNEINLQKTLVHLSKNEERRFEKLRKSKLSTDQKLQARRIIRIKQALKLQTLKRVHISKRNELLSLEGELSDLPLKAASNISEIEREIAQIEQALAEEEGRREIVVSAPVSGTITTMLTEQGNRSRSNVPLLSIVPSGSKLQAQLFSPSRAIGFLHPGQNVQLRYQAYPYQKFGHYEGEIERISHSAISRGELPLQLAGLTSLFVSTEPVYRIVVDLAEQHVTAYGKPVTLQPGMQLEADVLIERRRLYEWMLDPLYTLTGRWQE